MGSTRAYCGRPNAGAGHATAFRPHNNAGAPAFVLRPTKRCHRRLPKWAPRRGFPGHTNTYKPDAPFRTSRRSSSIVSPLVSSSLPSPRYSPAKRFAFCSSFHMLSDRLYFLLFFVSLFPISLRRFLYIKAYHHVLRLYPENYTSFALLLCFRASAAFADSLHRLPRLSATSSLAPNRLYRRRTQLFIFRPAELPSAVSPSRAPAESGHL